MEFYIVSPLIRPPRSPGVSRFTNGGFLRIKTGKALEKRDVSTRVFETRREAEVNLAQEK